MDTWMGTMNVNDLYGAKLKVMAAVPYLRKQGKMDSYGQKYTYAREADFIDRLHPAMREAGLTVGAVGYELVHDSMFERAGGKGLSRRVILLATIRLGHVSGQFENYQAVGEAIDTGDKACGKAMTMALKYALRQMFLVETGDDPDDVGSDQHEAAGKSREVTPTRPNSPVADKPAQRKGFKIAELCAEIAMIPEYREWTPQGMLRRATGKNWSEDQFRTACNSDDPRIESIIKALEEMRDAGQ